MVAQPGVGYNEILAFVLEVLPCPEFSRPVEGISFTAPMVSTDADRAVDR